MSGIAAAQMSADQAYSLLGVREGAGFDEILTAKNKLTKANEHDQDKIVKASMQQALLMFCKIILGCLRPVLCISSS